MWESKVRFGKILHFDYETKKEMMLAFARVSEFSESPVPTIKGAYTSWSDFLAVEMSESGRVKYFQEWEGFNFPRITLANWVWVASEQEITKYEAAMIDEVLKHPEVTYITACLKGDEETLEHELAHGLYETNEPYKEAVKEAMPKGIVRQELFDALMAGGYDSAVPHLIDECQAYLVSGGQDVFYPGLLVRAWTAMGVGDVASENPVRVIFNNFMKEELQNGKTEENSTSN